MRELVTASASESKHPPSQEREEAKQRWGKSGSPPYPVGSPGMPALSTVTRPGAPAGSDDAGLALGWFRLSHCTNGPLIPTKLRPLLEIHTVRITWLRWR